MADQPTCYVCYDDVVVDELLLSPCGECKMHVHRMCLDRCLMRASTRDKCAVIQVTEHGEDKYVAYGSCTVCKRRFEYESEVLVSTLRQTSLLMRMLVARFAVTAATATDETDETDPNTAAEVDIDHRHDPYDAANDARLPLLNSPQPFATALDVVRALPPDLQAPMQALMQVVDESMHTMTPDEMVVEWRRCVRYIEWVAVVVLGCGMIGAGVVLRTVLG
jgi:hypothetical protein